MNMRLKSQSTGREFCYSPAQVAKVTGLSAHMVNYLCRNDLVTPTGCNLRGRGRARRYTFADIVLLRVVATLLRQGISVLGFRKSFLSAKKRQSNVRLLLGQRYLVTDGVSVFLQNQDVLERIDTGQLSFAFVLDLVSIRDDVVKKLNIKVA